ncbi:MAG: poly-beta-1,6-N-acetyl-D-glucosamine biosynthesis protein PgaD [Methylomonas sp.]|nr:MAG: poly-beta-1,6-N-acetyl-D-glucosamine biosynthesis protein PgaD [Methylomonas sp.]
MKRPLIINTPSLQSLQQRYVSAFLTFIFWVIWFFLWTPLITLFGWLSGLDLIYIQMIELEGFSDIAEDFSGFLISVAIFGGLLGFWALYNFLRFKDIERRAAITPVNNQQLAAFFGVGVNLLGKQQQAQCLSISFDDQGNISQIGTITKPIAIAEKTDDIGNKGS